MQLFKNISESITNNFKRNAFYINETYYTYENFAQVISNIRLALQRYPEKNVGLVLNDDLETYASIIALWLEGKFYVPLNPDTPMERNLSVIDQAALTILLDSSEQTLFYNLDIILTKKVASTKIDLSPKIIPDTDVAYLLFTSGTTGIPKGVPISRYNLEKFIVAFDDLGYDINENDKVLQMFELTFDLSVMSYLVPILKGACVFTIPKSKIKYSYIFELMDEHHITIALMVPSIIHYLRPYFEEINCPKMKYSLFCGEALPLNITNDWSKCIPNSKIINVYGPTENTIFCTHYEFKRNENNKSLNGVLSIGRAMKGIQTIIIDENNRIIKDGEKGELCLSGDLLTEGYWKNEVKTNESFFNIDHQGILSRFYKTGDLCFCDEDGDIMYVGRTDSQTKIQGFRVELSEIEHYAKMFLEKIGVVAIPVKNKINNTEIGLVIEAEEFDTTDLLNFLKVKMPSYMIPTQIKFINNFPLNSNGKTDRNSLKQIF
jgi:amino acid adenylation domain-containing protein